MPGLPESSRAVFGIKLFRSWIDVGRIDIERRRFRSRLRTCERLIGSFSHQGINLVLDSLQFVLVDDSFFDQQRAKTFDRIALSVGRSLFVGTIEPFVI